MKRWKLTAVPHSDFVLTLGLFAWGLLMAWAAFGGTDHSKVALVVASLFFALSFGIPAALGRISDFTGEGQSPRNNHDRVETHTGTVHAPSARIQTLLPVGGVSVGFTLIGLVFISI